MYHYIFLWEPWWYFHIVISPPIVCPCPVTVFHQQKLSAKRNPLNSVQSKQNGFIYVKTKCSVGFFNQVCVLFIASISNGSPSTLRSPHRAEEESLTEEFTGKAHTHYTRIYHKDRYWTGYSCEGVCVCVCACVGGSWMWNMTDGARSLLIQRQATNLNTLLLIYLML